MKSGAYYAAKFATKCAAHGEDVVIHTETAGTPCPGAYNPYNEEYDPSRDRAYHAAHPAAPVCDHGLVGAVATATPAQAFVGFSLTEELVKILPEDEFEQGDLLFFFPAATDLTGVQNITYLGEDYGIYRYDPWLWDNTVLYHYALGRLISTGV